MFFNLVDDYRGLILATCAFLLIYLFRKRNQDKLLNLPPGPFSLPVFGNFLLLATATHVDLEKLKKKYGDVCRIKAGSSNLVVLNSERAIRDAYNKDEFMDKPPYDGFSVYGNKSAFFSHDLELWREQRGFIVRIMRDLGLGKMKIDEHIQDEIVYLFDYLEKKQGIPVCLEHILEQSTANNICGMLLGKRFNFEDPSLMLFLRAVKEFTKNVRRSGVFVSFPWIRHLSPILRRIPNFIDFSIVYQTVDVFKKEIIEEHRKTYNEENIRDFVDRYLQEMKKKEGSLTFTEDLLVITAMEFIGTGSETTTSCLMWCIYTIAAYPDIKEKLLKEIEEIVGLSRMPSASDQKLMPYTQAFLHEVIRWVTIVPIAPLRYTLKDTSVCGYDIPKNTVILGNFWAAHHDPDVWVDPHSFRPERFLGPDRVSLKKPPTYIPFSIGKRKCPGESMAYMEAFLYTVTILQKFDIYFPPGVKPTFKTSGTVSVIPKNFKICMTSRTKSINVTFV